MVPSPESRVEWVGILRRLANPVLMNLANGTLKVRMPVEQAAGANRRPVTHLEALGRLVAGIAPWIELPAETTEEGTLRARYADLTRRAISRAVDPASPDFLNFVRDRQPLVDAAFLAQGVLRAPRALREALDPTTTRHLVAALESTRTITPGFNNWLLFSATVEAGLARLGAPWDRTRVDYALRRREQWYRGDGASTDGPDFHFDYYNSFVIHPMLLDVLDVCRTEMPAWQALAGRVELRARRYAAVLERSVAPDGSFPVVGQSLAYRCGAFHLLAQMALRHALPENVGLEAPAVRDQPAEDSGGGPRRPARFPFPPRGRASVRWRSETRCTLPSRRARGAPGPRPAARSWRRSWRAPAWTATARPATGSRRWSTAGSAPSFARSSRRAAREFGRRSRCALGLGGAVVRGKIDLLAELPEGPLSSGSKTDALQGSDPAELAERYETQRDLYALAVQGARRNGDAAIVRAAYCFLEAPERASVGAPTRPGQPRRASASSVSSRESEPATSGAQTTHTPRSATGARRRRACAGSPRGAPGGPPRAPERRRGRVSERRPMSPRLAVFAYGSLVSPASAALTLGRSVEARSPRAWRVARRWSQARDNGAARRRSPAPMAARSPGASA